MNGPRKLRETGASLNLREVFATTATLIALLSIVAPSRAAVVMTMEAPSISAPQVAGATVMNFDAFQPGALGSRLTAIGRYSSTSSDVWIMDANQYGGAGGVGKFLGAYANSVASVQFLAPQGYFGIWWSAIDGNWQGGNQVSVTTVAGDIHVFGQSDIFSSGLLQAGHFGAGQASAFINFFATDESSKLTSIRIGGGNFESDNHSIRQSLTDIHGGVVAIQGKFIPEPSSIVLIWCALLATRMRRRFRATSYSLAEEASGETTTPVVRATQHRQILNSLHSRLAQGVALAVALGFVSVAKADWLIKSYSAANYVENYADADALIAGVGLAAGFPVAAQYPIAHVQDNDGQFTGDLGLGQQIVGLPGFAADSDNFVFLGQGNLTVNASGQYRFRNATDDGSRLRISVNGGPMQQIITDDVLSAMHFVTSEPVTLSAGDSVQFEWMWYDRTFGGEGAVLYHDGVGPLFKLLGDSSLGLSLNGGTYTGTAYKARFQPINSFVDAEAVKNLPGSEQGAALRNVFNVFDNATDGLFTGGEPSPGINTFSTHFLTQGTGLLVVRSEQSGHYLFRSANDDGARLRIDLNIDGDFDDDGELLINDDVIESSHLVDSPIVLLPAGSFPIEYSYFNSTFRGEGEISAMRVGVDDGFTLLGDEAAGGLDVVQIPEPSALFHLLATGFAVALHARHRLRSSSR